MSKRRQKRNYSKNNKSVLIILLVILLLILTCGLVYYFVFYQDKKEDQLWNPNQTTGIYKVNEDNGFIVDNYSLIDEGVLENNHSEYATDYDYIRNLVSDHSPIGFDLKPYNDNQTDYSYNYRIGHWNTLNFSMLSDKPTDKAKIHAENIAKMISYLEYDLIGLTEINKDTVKETDFKKAKNFLDLVNNYVSKENKDKYQYDLIVSKNTNSKTAKDGQVEQVAILYNTKKLKIDNNSNSNDALIGSGDFYSNPLINAYSKDRDFVRTPFGSSFVTIDNPNNTYKFSTVFSHFDSPGNDKIIDNGTTSGIGNQELFESQQIDDVLDEFKTKYNNDNVIFMGDTNIKTKKQTTAFDMVNINKNNYQFAFKDTDEYNTSLATTATVNKYPNDKLKWYSNAYDKIIYHLNDFIPKLDNNNDDTNLG